MFGRKKERFLGFLIFSIGIGIILAVIVPRIGWIVLSALFLICAGLYLLKRC